MIVLFRTAPQSPRRGSPFGQRDLAPRRVVEDREVPRIAHNGFQSTVGTFRENYDIQPKRDQIGQVHVMHPEMHTQRRELHSRDPLFLSEQEYRAFVLSRLHIHQVQTALNASPANLHGYSFESSTSHPQH